MADCAAGNNVFKASVIIPLYNKAEFVGAALESVLAQNCPPAEILVVDDGSTDNGPAIVESFGPKRVRLIAQPNAGPGIARNHGIEQSTQPWVAFLDADDLWLPDHLAHLAELHRTFPEIAILATGYEEFWGDAPDISIPRKTSRMRELDFFELDPTGPNLSSSSVAVKASALRAAGGFGASFPGEDVELWIRLGLDYRVVFSSEVTALYRRESQGLTHDYLSRDEPEQLPIFAPIRAALADPRHRARHPLLAKYRDRWLLTLARQALGKGNVRLARSYLAKVVKIDRQWAFLAALAALPAGLVRRTMTTRSALKRARTRRPRTG
jgi:glycosyltransferase involved in cell wall biosynthesis